MMEKVTVIINNRDLLTWPMKMCEEISRMSALHEIVILDNGSSNRQLLQWYKNCPYKVLFVDNIGHTAPWDTRLIDHLATDLYVVTDPDLDLSSVPDDALEHLTRILRRHPELEKVGLSLVVEGIPSASPYFDHVQNYEKQRQSGPVIDEQFWMAPIDTTFALYDRRTLNEYKIVGARTVAPYSAKHIPWHIVSADDEFLYYLENASGASSSYKWFTGHKARNDLEKLYADHHGKVSTKWESYFPIYDRWFKPYRDERISLLEIGVQNGGSLDIWSSYFRKADILIGCDINPAVEQLVYPDPRIRIVAGAATAPEVFAKIRSIQPRDFDIIIDDGSHASLDTISNFVAYFPTLKPGGVYAIEDMHCAYWPEYQGGFFNHRSAAHFFKALFDLVNIEHSRQDFSATQLFQSFFGVNPLPSCLSDGSIYSISCYNSVFIIEKSSPDKQPKLGRVVIVGDEALVDSRVLDTRAANDAKAST